MKKKNLIFILFVVSILLIFQSCKVLQGNTTSVDKTNVTETKTAAYKIWLIQLDGVRYRGILHSADKNGVYISGTISDEPEYLIKPEVIEIIKIRRKGKVGKSALIGGVSSFLITGGIAYATYKEKDCFLCNLWSREETALMVGVPFGVLGTGVGALAGSSREEFVVNGNTEVYLNHLRTLNKYTIVKKPIQNE